MDILEIINVPYHKKGNTIHIKKENRGKFTRSAKEHNMGVLEFATHVLNNKDKYSPTLIKRANFAKNSKKFKHAKGGLIKKYQEGNLIIPQIDENSIDKNYVQSYFMAKDKNYFIKDWLNKRKDILDKNLDVKRKISWFPDMVNDVLTELQEQLSNLNSVKEYAYDNDIIDFLPNYTESSNLKDRVDNYHYLNFISGFYTPFSHEILYRYTDPNTIIHERTHSLNAIPQEDAINQLNIKIKNDYPEYRTNYYKSKNIDNSYFDDPLEIYARLMSFRYANKLDPNKTYTIEDVKKFKEDPDILDFELLNRYSEEDVLKLLNEIAYNNINESINMAKKGCKLKRKIKKCQEGEILDKQTYTVGHINSITGKPSVMLRDPNNINPITGRPSIVILNNPNIHPEREPLSEKEKETIELQKQTKAYKYLNTITDFTPVVGTIKEGYRFIENPTFKQGLRTIGSGIADYLGYRILTTPPKIPRPLSMWERSKPKIRRRSTTPKSLLERQLDVEMSIFPVTFDNVILNLPKNENEKEVNTKKISKWRKI